MWGTLSCRLPVLECLHLEPLSEVLTEERESPQLSFDSWFSALLSSPPILTSNTLCKWKVPVTQVILSTR